MELDEELAYNLYRRGSVNGVGKFQYGLDGVPTGHTQESYDKRIYETITRAAVAIFEQKRVSANWMIGGVDWLVQLGLPSLWTTNTEEQSLRSFLKPVTPLLGQIDLTVAASPWPAKEAIMGHKGTDGFVDASAFYMPYLPLQLTGVLFDPNTQKRNLSWITRYAIFNNAFSGQNENYAYLTLNASITGTSYAATVEYL